MSGEQELVERVARALQERDDYLAELGGCGDGNCIVVQSKGMHTNGGCHCWRDGIKMQRFAYANGRFATAIRQQIGASHEG